MSACGGATGYTPGGLVVVAVGRASWTERGRWVDKGTQVNSMSKHTGDVNAVQFTPDGKLLASGADDSSVMIVELTK